MWLIRLKLYLLRQIALQRMEYEPVDVSTYDLEDGWCTNDIYELEMWSHRYIPPALA